MESDRETGAEGEASCFASPVGGATPDRATLTRERLMLAGGTRERERILGSWDFEVGARLNGITIVGLVNKENLC